MLFSEALKNAENSENELEALRLYTSLVINFGVTSKERMKALLSCFERYHDHAKDLLYRFRDTLAFSSGKMRSEIIKTLCDIISDPGFEDFERMQTVICLFNNHCYEICFDMFRFLIADPNLHFEFCAECCRYLYCTDDLEQQNKSRDIIFDIINDLEISSENRYGIIAGFSNKTGLTTLFNHKKLKTYVDDEFYHDLQLSFFNTEENNLDKRLLSAGALLDLQDDITNKEERLEIENKLFEIAKNPNNSENMIGTALDIIWRLGQPKNKPIAKKMIAELGSKDQDEKNLTIYSDTQNVHRVEEFVNNYIETFISKPSVTLKDYKTTKDEVIALIKSKIPEQKKRYEVLKGINRITIDDSKFTSFKITLSEILCYVWAAIQEKPESERDGYYDNLIIELLNMEDTCSSGYSSRLVNVICPVQIDWNDQIKANISGRMNALIRNIEDEEVSDAFVNGTMENADPKDRELYNKTVAEFLDKIRNEMYSEFVTEKYISEDDFEKYFKDGSRLWIL